MHTGIFFQISSSENNMHTVQQKHTFSRFNLLQNWIFFLTKRTQKPTQFVPNCFEPALMLGLSSMAIEWPQDKGIPNRRRTLPHWSVGYLLLFFLFFFFPFLLSFFLFFLSFFLSFLPLFSIPPNRFLLKTTEFGFS